MRRLLALLGLALLGAEAPPLHGDPVVLELPGMADVAVRTLTWGTSGQLFLYLPPAAKERAPVVVFAIGYSDDEAQRRFGAPLHRYRQYDSWARLAAVSGFAGVTYATQNPERDLPGQHAFDVSDSSVAAQDAVKATLLFMLRAAGLEPKS